MSTMFGRIEQEGVITGKGKTRATVRLYLTLHDRFVRLATHLGFERKTKPVQSLEQFLQSQEGDQP
jgi:hypothetical protein